MAITHTLLAGAHNGTDGTTFATASFDPPASELCLFGVAATRGSSLSPPTPTIQRTGGGEDVWDLVRSLAYDVSGTTRASLWVFRMMADEESATRTITFSATVTSCRHSVVRFAGVDTSGSNGAGAIVQSLDTGAADVGTSNSVTLAAFGSANNAGYGWMDHQANEAITAGMANELHDVAGTSPACGAQSQYAINDTLVDWSWTTSIANGGIAIEIKADAGVAVDIPYLVTARR